MLLFLLLLPELVVELDVAVVVTKNRSGTIVTAENKMDIEFSARHVFNDEMHENDAGWILSPFREHKSF